MEKKRIPSLFFLLNLGSSLKLPWLFILSLQLWQKVPTSYLFHVKSVVTINKLKAPACIQFSGDWLPYLLLLLLLLRLAGFRPTWAPDSREVLDMFHICASNNAFLSEDCWRLDFRESFFFEARYGSNFPPSGLLYMSSKTLDNHRSELNGTPDVVQF